MQESCPHSFPSALWVWPRFQPLWKLLPFALGQLSFGMGGQGIKFMSPFRLAAG